MTSKKHKVMLVDDESTSRILLTKMLHQHYNLVVLGNSQDCLHEAPSHSPDAILIDVIMPDLNGYQLCEWLKSEPTTDDIPIILISSLEQDSQLEDFEMSGAIAYLEKPVTKEILLDTIDMAIMSRNTLY